MASFSIRRVALFARYHYAMQWTKYMSMVLLSIGVPVLFAVISNDLYVAESMSGLVYIVGSLAMAMEDLIQHIAVFIYPTCEGVDFMRWLSLRRRVSSGYSCFSIRRLYIRLYVQHVWFLRFS